MNDFNVRLKQKTGSRPQHQCSIKPSSNTAALASRRRRKLESARKETLERARTEALCAVDHGIFRSGGVARWGD